MAEEEQKTRENIARRVIEDEMKESYLAYSMSVIVGRALPDIRDGLKPVHRRILYAMYDMGMLHNRPFKKSARIVGECLGKYHPHGDTAVYDSMVRMAQEFSLRYPLVDGQGNFGSVDGDSAASMRYTEARLKKISEEIIQDIDKETVDFTPNFDGSLSEPAFLPCKIPNLLINGSSGIAVGMATNIPPHNITEICDGLIRVADNPECEFEELAGIVKGPDFPTGGIILGTAGIKEAYAKGRGKIRIQSRTNIEEAKGRKRIIVTEIPYMVNKSMLLEQIADCVRDKLVEGISDLRDESDRDGMRIVIELKQNANEQITLNQLFKHTRMQETFGIILLSLVNNEPKVLSLRSMFKYFLIHRKEVVRKRTEFDLKVAKEREHILQGLIIALNDIDSIVQKIKKSKTVEDASAMLQTDYSLSEKQTKAILEMRLQKLASLEQQKIREEMEELLKQIKELTEILADEQKILAIIKNETEEIKQSYGDKRRTDIAESGEEIDDEDLIKEETVVVTLSNEGYIKRMPVDAYHSQKRGGKGIIAATTKEEDFIEQAFIASTHAHMLIFTDKGKVYWKKTYQVPEASRTAKGIPIINFVEKEQDEKVTTVIPVSGFEPDKYLFFATKKGTVKRTKLEYFSNPRRGGIIALGLDEGDKLINAALTDGKQQIMLATENGRAVKFNETDVRDMGRTAVGVRGIRIKEGDEVVGMIIANDKDTLLTITDKGYGKRTIISDYRLINRGGSGVINIKCTEKNGKVVSIKSIEDDEDILIISKKGVAIRVNAGSISTIGRNTQGVRIMKLNEGDEVMCVAKCAKEEIIEQKEETKKEQKEETKDETKEEKKGFFGMHKKVEEIAESKPSEIKQSEVEDEVAEAMKKIQSGQKIKKNPFFKRIFGL
jgi:DNA gyrase subunit A